MRNFLVLMAIVVSTFGCTLQSTTEQSNKKQTLLSSLKQKYAGKPVNITLTNNQSGTAPITNQYAYTDENKSDLAFKLEGWLKYRLADEEGFLFVPTLDKPEPSEMVLIEITNGSLKRGFVHYSFIKEFNELSYYK